MLALCGMSCLLCYKHLGAKPCPAAFPVRETSQIAAAAAKNNTRWGGNAHELE